VAGMTISPALSGVRPMPAKLRFALVDLLGEAWALEILDAIPEHYLESLNWEVPDAR
jgi:hypothetical protein